MPSADQHEEAALEAIETAEQAGPEESGPGQVYATVAVAQALLALRAELSSLKDILP